MMGLIEGKFPSPQTTASILGAAIVAGIINSPQVPKLYPTVISIIVACATGIVTSFRLSQRSAIANSTAESIATEINELDLQVGKYENLDSKHAPAPFQHQIGSLVKNKSAQMAALEQQIMAQLTNES
ncbi:MAG TPA: hypothetical protein VEH81_15340 [Ktedonobacteraceae bacterium]|nr:hypothetical protein [Ktedonobacteraceae bacterium]